MPVAHLYPRTPYDFSLSAAIFAGGDPQIRTYEDDLFLQALDIGGNPVLVEVFFEQFSRSEKSCFQYKKRFYINQSDTFSYPYFFIMLKTVI